MPQVAREEREQALPVPLRRGLVIDALALWEGEAVLRARVPLDAVLHAGGTENAPEFIDLLLRRPAVDLGAGEVELALDARRSEMCGVGLVAD